eukprot:2105723-Rhodomonas_salina.2
MTREDDKETFCPLVTGLLVVSVLSKPNVWGRAAVFLVGTKSRKTESSSSPASSLLQVFRDTASALGVHLTTDGTFPRVALTPTHPVPVEPLRWFGESQNQPLFARVLSNLAGSV